MSLEISLKISFTGKREHIMRLIATLACTALLGLSSLTATSASAQMAMDKPGAPPASPAATAKVTLGGKDVTVNYGAPSIRGRKIMGGLVPYGEVWRTGANEATTLITTAELKIGTLTLPAGTYTLFTLPTASSWQLIVSKATGEWGIPYPEGKDFGRTPLMGKTLGSPQEVMSISFENTKGNSTELHIKWEKTDQYVTVTAT
ncbi:hypothetical protein BH10ACI4_BH10ACI4_01200 [soil metagenome]